MDSLWKKAAEFLYNRRKDKRWRKIVTCLAAVVVFVTTYALILPAITMDDETAEQEPGVVLIQDEAAAELAIAEADSAEANVSDEEMQIESEGSDEEEAIVIDSDNGADDADVADPDAEEAGVQLIDVTEDDSTEPITKTYQDDEIEITATYGTEANIPEDAEFRVTKLAVEETDEADEAVSEESEEIEAADTAEVTERYRYDIGFYVGEEEIEPEAAVSLSVRFLAGQFAEAEEITAVHYLDDNDPSNTETIQPEINEDQNGNVQAEFDMDSFSVVEFQGSNVVSEDAQAESEENTTELQTMDAPTVLADGVPNYTLTYQPYLSSSSFTINVFCVNENGEQIPGDGVTNQTYSSVNEQYIFADNAPSISGYEYQSAHWNSISGTVITSVTTAWQRWQYGWKTSASDDLHTSGDVYLVYQQGSGEKTVTFNANDGTGDAPEALTVAVGAEITFPNANSLTPPTDLVFIGWSTNKSQDCRSENILAAPLYQPDETYIVTEDITFYAIWAEKNVDAVFYIALDGVPRTEPRNAGNDNADFTHGYEIENALSAAKFYSNSTGVDGKDGNVINKPTAEQLYELVNHAIENKSTIIVGGLNVPNVSISEDKQHVYAVGGELDGQELYVVWYVTKRAGCGPIYKDKYGNEKNGAQIENEWHVDGVLLAKSLVTLTYAANAPGGAVTNMPDGTQYTVDSPVLAGEDRGNKERVLTPSRTDGYIFAGWKMYTPDENGDPKYNSNGTVTGTPGGTYQTDDTFTITKNTLLVAQWVKDTTSLKVQKTDEKGQLIDTAKFTLDNTEKQTENGVADFGKIELNTRYALKETVAPDGYEIRTDTIYFEETKNDSTYTVTYYKDAAGSDTIEKPSWVKQELVAGNLTLSISDERSKATIKIKKKESGTSTLLSNAEFTLYRSATEADDQSSITNITDANGGKISVVAVEGFGTITTDQDGLARIDNLPTGDYYLVETKAPDGYNQLEHAIHFKLNAKEIVLHGGRNASVDEDDPLMLVVYNSAGRELPHTGGSGTTLFTFGGLAILAGCLMAGYSMRRNRERRSE